MSKVKAHIVVDEEKIDKPETREKLLKKLKRTAKITDINEKRYELYGVLTATLDDANLEKVRNMPEIKGVEIDDVKHLQ
jgi:hypothetical protein